MSATTSFTPTTRFRSARPAPWTVRTAFWTLVCQLAAAVTVAVYWLVTSGWFIFRSGVLLSLAIMFAVFAALALAFYGFLAARLYRGHRWARVVHSLLVSWNVVTVASADRSVRATDPMGTAFDVLLLLAAVSSAVLLWLPVSNRYFRHATDDRRRFRAGLHGLRAS